MGAKLPELKEVREAKDKLVRWLSGDEIGIGSWQDKLAVFSDKMTWKRWLGVAGGLVVVLLVSCMLAFGTSAGHQRNLNPDQVIYLSVKPGMSASDIGDELVRHGVLDGKFSFWWKTRQNGVASRFKIGMYALHPGMQADEVLQKLTTGDTTVVKFTIPEGFGVRDIAKRLAEQGLVDEQEFLDKAKNYAPYDYIERKPDVRYACEGFLFPDTYELHEETSVDSILKMMADDFDHRLTPELRARAQKQDISIHDLITLASLVEKEALYAEDRPIIAQVFFKRLKLDMPLQSDTTLQYLLDGPKEDVSIKDTQIDSPYNTYQIKGLPPGPIASPGMAAIKAVLYPADTDYLYFVADRQGHNHYSKNYSDHEAAVNQFR